MINICNYDNVDKEQHVDNSNKNIPIWNFWRSQTSITILTQCGVLTQCWHNVDTIFISSWQEVNMLTQIDTHTHTHCCHDFTMTRPGEGEAAWMRATKSIFQLLKVLVCLFVFYFATSGLVLVVVYVVIVSFSVTDL